MAFSPIASGTPVALRSFASDFEILRRPDRLLDPVRLGRRHGGDRRLGLAGSPGAVGVDHDRDVRPGDLARGRDRVGGALVQLDVAVAALERTRGVALHVLDVAGVMQQRGIGFDARALAPPSSLYTGTPSSLPRMSHSAMSRPLSACHHRTGAAEAMQHALDAAAVRLASVDALSDGDDAGPSDRRQRPIMGARRRKRLAPADNAVAGGHAHQQASTCVRGTPRESSAAAPRCRAGCASAMVSIAAMVAAGIAGPWCVVICHRPYAGVATNRAYFSYFWQTPAGRPLSQLRPDWRVSPPSLKFRSACALAPRAATR